MPGGNLDDHFNEMFYPAPGGGILQKLKEKVNTFLENSSKAVDAVGGPRNLAAVHTLDAGKLKEAAALGGMPMPSVAVTRLDRPYDWGRGEVVTEIMDRRDNVLVAVKIGTGTLNDVEANIHRIKSLYGKESIEKLLTHPVLYWNKAKARIWMKNGGLQLPTTPHLTAGFRGTILKPADLIKYKNQHGLSF